MRKRGKKGQITIFIILAILIIAVIGLFFLFRTQISEKVGISKPENPQSFLETCMQDRVKEAIKLIELHGGYIAPRAPSIYFKFTNQEPIDISYLCYTSDNYFPCINYEPLLMNHLKNEIKNYISDAVGNCFDELTASLERQGHSVEVSGIEGDFDVELRNRKVVIKINKELTLTRADETSKYENFAIEIPSKIYDLATVVQEIVSVESNNRLDNKFALGGWLKSYGLIKKIGITRAETSDYSEVYSVEDEITKEKFYFAIRSKVLSVPGY